MRRGLSRRDVLAAGAATVTAAVLPGCAPPREEPRPEAPERIVWPRPPAPARLAYQTTIRTSADVHAETEVDRLRALLGAGQRPEVPFAKPFAVAARGGMVYVSDTVMRLVHAFDLGRRRYFPFGYRFEGALQKPLGMAVDAAGKVYVADPSGVRVVIYDRLGLYQGEIRGGADFTRPADVTVTPDGTRLFVVDVGGVESERHRVLAYDAGGTIAFAIGERGADEGQFNLPVGAALAPDGTLYVLDAGNFRVQAFTPRGAFLRAYGSVGRGLGQFARPKAIAVDRTGNVYVADASFGNVQIFDPLGRLLLPVGRSSRDDAPGNYALLTGVASDEAGFVYLLDQVFRKVEVLRLLDSAGGAGA